MSPENPLYPSPFSFYFPVRNALVSFVPVTGGMEIKTLQTGTIVLTTELLVYHPITPVDLDHSLLVFTGQAPGGSDFRSVFARLGWQNNASIFAARGGNVHGLTVGYMVIEFEGLTKNVLHKEVICDGVTDNTVTIDSRSLNKTILIHNGCQSDFDNFGCCLSRIWLDNETTLHCKKVNFNGWSSTKIEVLELP